ncbi:MAG: hypothetical protein Q9216_002490 [Gyalolechia sp. 2 TL-2023]
MELQYPYKGEARVGGEVLLLSCCPAVDDMIGQPSELRSRRGGDLLYTLRFFYAWDETADYIQTSDWTQSPGGPTSYAYWAPNNLPDILYTLFPPAEWKDFRLAKLPDAKFDKDGHVVFEQWPAVPNKPQKLLNFPHLPDQIGSQEWWFILEAWKRLDPRIRWRDITMRIHGPSRPLTHNNIQMNMSRNRSKWGMVSWCTTRLHENYNKARHEALNALSVEQVTRNTTRGITPGLKDPALGEAGGRVPVPDHIGRTGRRVCRAPGLKPSGGTCQRKYQQKRKGNKTQITSQKLISEVDMIKQAAQYSRVKHENENGSQYDDPSPAAIQTSIYGMEPISHIQDKYSLPDFGSTNACFGQPSLAVPYDTSTHVWYDDDGICNDPLDYVCIDEVVGDSGLAQCYTSPYSQDFSLGDPVGYISSPNNLANESEISKPCLSSISPDISPSDSIDCLSSQRHSVDDFGVARSLASPYSYKLSSSDSIDSISSQSQNRFADDLEFAQRHVSPYSQDLSDSNLATLMTSPVRPLKTSPLHPRLYPMVWKKLPLENAHHHNASPSGCNPTRKESHKKGDIPAPGNYSKHAVSNDSFSIHGNQGSYLPRISRSLPQSGINLKEPKSETLHHPKGGDHAQKAKRQLDDKNDDEERLGDVAKKVQRYAAKANRFARSGKTSSSHYLNHRRSDFLGLTSPHCLSSQMNEVLKSEDHQVITSIDFEGSAYNHLDLSDESAGFNPNDMIPKESFFFNDAFTQTSTGYSPYGTDYSKIYQHSAHDEENRDSSDLLPWHAESSENAYPPISTPENVLHVGADFSDFTTSSLSTLERDQFDLDL